MSRARRTGATAAAALPAALAGALLVSAPFAGTSTAPLANSHTSAFTAAAPAAPRAVAAGAHGDNGVRLSVSPASLATMAAAELALVGVGVGVLVVARRRRHAED